jgi:hypothetical protein
MTMMRSSRRITPDMRSAARVVAAPAAAAAAAAPAVATAPLEPSSGSAGAASAAARTKEMWLSVHVVVLRV